MQHQQRLALRRQASLQDAQQLAPVDRPEGVFTTRRFIGGFVAVKSREKYQHLAAA